MKKICCTMMGCALLLGGPVFAAPGKTAKKGKPAVVEAATVQAEVGNVLHSFARMISFDPHPTVIEPLGPNILNVNGKKVSYVIEFLEGWETKGAHPNLKELGFIVQMMIDGREAKRFTPPKTPLDAKKLKKGDVLFADSLDDLSVNILVDEKKVQGKALTEVVVMGQLLARNTGNDSGKPTSGEPGERAIAPEPILEPITSPPPVANSGFELAKRLAEKADAMPETSSTGKLILYKKALAAAPADSDDPQVNAFVTAMAEHVSLLEGQTTAKTIVRSANPAGSSASRPSAYQPAPEVQALYDSALQQFALQKEAEGRDFLRKAVEKDPQFHAAWFQLAKNAFANSRHARVKEAAEKALALKDDDLDSAVLFFKSCYYLGEAESGLEKISALVQKYPKNGQARLALAEAYFQAGDLPASQEICEKLVAESRSAGRAGELLQKVRERMK